MKLKEIFVNEKINGYIITNDSKGIILTKGMIDSNGKYVRKFIRRLSSKDYQSLMDAFGLYCKQRVLEESFPEAEYITYPLHNYILNLCLKK